MKVIIISAINFRSGGPLSILNDCLEFLDTHYASNYKIIALIHHKKVLRKSLENIEFIEFPKSIKSYIFRLYYEYFYFKRISKKYKPYLWLSLHDMTPNVESEIRAVYCHNPSSFYKISLKEFFLDKKFYLFTLFYKKIYKKNINKNDYVIVQHDWLRREFKNMFSIKECVVAYPVISINKELFSNATSQDQDSDKIKFFYPSFPRVFKNFEIACEAFKKLPESYKSKAELIITIDGTENKYSKHIYKKFSEVKNIKFIGLQSREKVFEFYAESDCLIFPSKLETWGLPISEYKEFNKPILLADFKYAHETVGNYDKVKFFQHDNSNELSQYICDFIDDKLTFESHIQPKPSQPFSRNWKELFKILLEDKND